MQHCYITDLSLAITGNKPMLQSFLSVLILLSIFILSVVIVWHAMPALTLVWVLLGMPTLIYFFAGSNII